MADQRRVQVIPFHCFLPEYQLTLSCSAAAGIEFASHYIKIVVVTMIKAFDFTIDKKASTLPVTLSKINRGFGVRRPRGDLYVRINMRD